MKNLHIIPTDKPSRLYFVKDKLKLSPLKFTNDKEVDWLTHNLYITNDEKIKVGDWVIEFQKGDNIGEVHFINGEYVIANDIQKKIIITTDQDLERVQSIDDEFLEWFVKNQSCEKVETIIVSTWCNDGKVCVCNVPKFCNEKRNDFKYKIIIPKEEQKELRRKLFTLIKSLEQEEPKQDPLEQAAKEYAEMHLDVSGNLGKYLVKAVFQDGALWQQKRMYSEEEMLQALNIGFTSTDETWEECVEFIKEQFKKK